MSLSKIPIFLDARVARNRVFLQSSAVVRRLGKKPGFFVGSASSPKNIGNLTATHHTKLVISSIAHKPCHPRSRESVICFNSPQNMLCQIVRVVQVSYCIMFDSQKPTGFVQTVIRKCQVWNKLFSKNLAARPG